MKKLGMVWVAWSIMAGSTWADEADEAGETRVGLSVLSDYVYRGFSYSNDRPTVALALAHEWRQHSVFVRMTPVMLGEKRRLQVQAGFAHVWRDTPQLQIWSGLTSTRSGLLPSLHEVVNGFVWRVGEHYVRTESFVALGGQMGSRHVDVELGWNLSDELTLAAAWGNTRQFGYLADADHDYYRVQLSSAGQRADWSLAFERAYDVGVPGELDDAPRVTAFLQWWL
ncbi:MAG: hypothetical protein AAF513_14085 [Pseudomonadota bacterium]